MSHFYLTLPSNSSANYYDNTLTKFTTRLQSSVSLTGEWEVGLSEIIFPHTWLTLDKLDAVFHVICLVYPDVHNDVRTIPNEVFTESYTVEVRISHGYYESV